MVALSAAFIALVVLTGCSSGGTATLDNTTSVGSAASAKPSGSANPASTAKPGGTAEPSASVGKSGAAAASGQLAPAKPTTALPTVTVSQLPREAQATLATIAAGGPYPYSRDGVVFENREGILPRRSSGYYHEYTVTTPGSSDRGARRIVTGKDGSRFYTDDHYDSFAEVVSR